MSVRRPPAPRLDAGTKTYYQRIEKLLEGEEDGGQEQVYLRNVVDQVIRDGARLVSSDKDGCRALELLLRHYSVDLESLVKLMEAIGPDFFKLCVNRCGSHVVQALLQAAGHCLCEQLKVSGSEDERLFGLFAEFVGVVQDKLLDCMKHPYACHVLGSLLQVLGGVKLPDKIGRSRYSLEFRSAKMGVVGRTAEATYAPILPEQFGKYLNVLAKSITKLKNLGEFMSHQNGSPVLQSLLRVLVKRQPEKSEKLIKKFIKLSRVLQENGHESAIPEVFKDLVGSHLMEMVVELAPSDLQQVIFDSCFKGQVVAFALHPVANFPLQQLISTASLDLLKNILKELTDLEEVLFVGHTGLVVQLVQAAVQYPPVQMDVFSLLDKAFHTEAHHKVIAQVILPLVTYEVYTDGVEKAKKENSGDNGGSNDMATSTLHGSLLLQSLLKFENPRVVAKSVLRFSEERLVRLSCDPCASHVITTFFTSHTVSAKKKQRMTSKVMPHVVQLCLDKYGSRVVDTLWKNEDLNKKKDIAKVLLEQEDKLSADFYGNIVLRNCDITSFKSQTDEWVKAQRHAGKKEEVFQDLLEHSVKRKRKTFERDGVCETKSKKSKYHE